MSEECVMKSGFAASIHVGDPLKVSILIGGGEENNSDSLSNGE